MENNNIQLSEWMNTGWNFWDLKPFKCVIFGTDQFFSYKLILLLLKYYTLVSSVGCGHSLIVNNFPNNISIKYCSQTLIGNNLIGLEKKIMAVCFKVCSHGEQSSDGGT